MYIPVGVAIVVILWFIYDRAKLLQQIRYEQIVKIHYRRMLLLSTKNEENYFKLLLRKYYIDSRIYDPLPPKEFNDLWSSISHDAESWTVGSAYITKKEMIVPPDIIGKIAWHIFKLDDDKDFLSLVRVHIAKDNKLSLDQLKNAVSYIEHDSFGNPIDNK